MAHNETQGGEFRIFHETYSKIQKSMLFAGDVWQEKTNDDTSSEIMRFFLKNGIAPQWSQTKTRARATFLKSCFDFGEGEMCFSLERCCNLKKPCLKRETETRFFDNRLKRERCRKNKKAVKSLQCERLNRRKGSVAAVSCAFFGPILWPEWSFFRTRARFLTQKHENVNIKRDQAPLARKRRCGRYGVKRFLFLQPL